MASFAIHLAVGKVYSTYHTIYDEKEFVRGILAPDLVDNKAQSHYTLKNRGNSLESYLKTKVNLRKFLEENKVDSDYEQGVFLHLFTDYEFFTNFFDKDYIRNVSYDDFCKDLYYSYDQTNEYLEKKYELNYYDFENLLKQNIKKDNQEKEMEQKENFTNILPFEKIDLFIERIGKEDLTQLKEKIMKSDIEI